MRRARLMIGAALALTSVWAIAQDAPESLLPPGFDKPAARPNRAPAPARTAAPAPRAPVPAAAPAPAPVTASTGSSDAAVVQQVAPVSGGSGGTSQSASVSSGSNIRIPSIEELEKLTPDELETALGMKPQFNLGASRRSLQKIGILGESEGGLPSWSLAEQNASLVRAAIAGNKGNMVSRWGHILLRRALASRMDAPEGIKPADFAAMRAALLVRMGEGEAARGLVQDVDPGNYSPDLTQAALDAYIFTADMTGACPIITAQGEARKDDQWQAMQAVCSAFRGDGNSALRKLDAQMKSADKMAGVDFLLAQKYAGAAGKARRAVKIEWDGVNDMTPWRYAFTIGVGLLPPDALMKKAGPRYDFMAATAPMVGLERRAAAADNAAWAGILSSAAMVDTYSQIYADQGITGAWAGQADLLHEAYVAATPAARLAAMRKLWDGGTAPRLRYSRQVLTAYAAARLPVDGGFKAEAPNLVASMLTAGLDQNAMRWFGQADVGSKEWGMLVLANAVPNSAIDASALGRFYSSDDSPEARRSGLLLAGLAGLERVTPETSSDFAEKLGIKLDRQTRWTTLIEQSADAQNPALVALLAGLGMQGEGWDKMTPLYLYHIVSTLRRVGFEAEARMIAAEAIARS